MAIIIMYNEINWILFTVQRVWEVMSMASTINDNFDSQHLSIIPVLMRVCTSASDKCVSFFGFLDKNKSPYLSTRYDDNRVENSLY